MDATICKRSAQSEQAERADGVSAANEQRDEVGYEPA